MMVSDSERNEALSSKKRGEMLKPFDASNPAERRPEDTARIAAALEYSAFELGEIRRQLEELVRIKRGK